MEEVELSKDLESISSHAFADCDRLRSLTIPESVIDIAHDAFCSSHNSPCPMPILLRVKKDSFAHQYAVKKNMLYEIIP